jgi:membrane-bound lytic murein transglycosylase D
VPEYYLRSGAAWLIARGFDAVGVIILRLVCAAPGALLLSLPAFADIGAVLPSSNVAAASPMLPLRPPRALCDAAVASFSESGASKLLADVSEPESAPVIAAPMPPIAEPLVEALESPPSAQYKDLWDRMRAGFALPDMKGRLVARHQAWYLNRPKYIQRMLARSQRYLYFIVEELDKRNMPTEIALLPMIESAYNPQADSRMRAVGIWQFIASTGRQYGLQQGAWYDGRRDVLSATRAALDYLQFLHDIFGDWQLAIGSLQLG